MDSMSLEEMFRQLKGHLPRYEEERLFMKKMRHLSLKLKVAEMVFDGMLRMSNKMVYNGALRSYVFRKVDDFTMFLEAMRSMNDEDCLLGATNG